MEFSEYKAKNSLYVWPTEEVFRWQAGPETHLFVILSPSAKGYDEFDVQIGWSKLGRFPELPARPVGQVTGGRSEFSEDEFVCSLCRFGDDDRQQNFAISGFSVSGFRDPTTAWKNASETLTGEDLERVIEPVIDDVMDRLRASGVPYLREFVSAHVADTD